MEYVIGGSLSDCLKKYKSRYGNAFPEEIVQYLMRQIVDAIKYIHQKNIIHRNLELDNIMVSFDNENDKNNCNMMKAKIKIIDFGFAKELPKDKYIYSSVICPINMDDLFPKELESKGKKINQLGDDPKADIWSLGTICYELLIGKNVFNAETMNDLVQKVENGSYSVPTSVSKEMVSFLNGMLQYDGENRLTAVELSMQPFLTKNVKDFIKIDTRRVKKKIDNKGLNINVKKNQTIWSIFNEEDEQKLIGINPKNIGAPPPLPPTNLKPVPEYQEDINKRGKTEKNVPGIHIDINKKNQKQYNKANSNNYPYLGPTNIYGQQICPNQLQYIQQYQIPGIPPYFFPYQQYQSGMGGYPPMIIYPTFAPSPSTFNANIYQQNRFPVQGYNPNNMCPPLQNRIYGYHNNNEVKDLFSLQ